jgi:hypothetical protein
MTASLLSRYELKYLIEPRRIAEIREAVRNYCALDEHCLSGDGFYSIDSLYFDTADYRFYHDSENKTPVRVKLRARTYPDAPGSIVKLEVKRRVHDVVVKSSAIVERDGWAKWLNGGGDRSGLPAETRRWLDHFLLYQTCWKAGPKMLVRYQRQALRSQVDDYVRITFDRRILCQPKTAYGLDARPNRWKPIDDPESIGLTGGVVMELKFTSRPPAWMADLVRRFGSVRQGYSKYGSAVRRIRTDQSVYWDLAPVPGWMGREAGSRWIF